MACFSRTSFSSKLRAVWEGRRGEGRGGEGKSGDMGGEVEAITPSL